MKQTIVTVEDDVDIAQLVSHSLANAGYVVRRFSTGQGVVEACEKEPPSLFLLDVMLPGKSGLRLCDEIRQSVALATIPVIFLTAKTSESDRVAGLELGGDDYITKPFSPRELIARIRAVLRRFERPLPIETLRSGDVEIDTGAMLVSVRGKRITTTATEFRLLEYFVRHIGRVFTRDQLLDAVWRDNAFVTPRSVDVYVRRLREKIERDPENPDMLRTVRGAGYRFGEPA
ncbi:MAG TPA: response regulator transcription factor [Terriglobales bacterium]|nr:response regulator transcription factor [Terriglobales bacterium]